MPGSGNGVEVSAERKLAWVEGHGIEPTLRVGADNPNRWGYTVMPNNADMLLIQELLRTLRRLRRTEQEEVLAFAHSLANRRASPDAEEPSNPPKKSLLGIFSDLAIGLTPEDIAEARKELWGSFPRPIPNAGLDGR